MLKQYRKEGTFRIGKLGRENLEYGIRASQSFERAGIPRSAMEYGSEYRPDMGKCRVLTPSAAAF